MRAPRPHDLLWGLGAEALSADAPGWARDVLAAGQPVVVRRGACAAGRVAVGIRGSARDLRLGCEMDLADIRRQLCPEALRLSTAGNHPALRALAELTPVLDASGLQWGPTGSVAYHLATGLHTLRASSDLDLLVRTVCRIEREQAKALLDGLENAHVRVDVQLETPAGAIALREWAGQSPRVLLKSVYGARLVADPWQAAQEAA